MLKFCYLFEYKMYVTIFSKVPGHSRFGYKKWQFSWSRNKSIYSKYFCDSDNTKHCRETDLKLTAVCLPNISKAQIQAVPST